MSRRPEVELLVALCRTPMATESVQLAVALASEKLDWDWFFARAELWQIEPAVMTNLASVAGKNLPREVSDRAMTTRLSSRATALSKILRTNHLVAKLGEAGIPVIVLKGPAISVTAYDDPSLRIFADADFLVKGEDLFRARDVVRQLGFAPLHDASAEDSLIRAGHALEFSSETFKVELHVVLLSMYLRVPFDLNDIWATARSVRCADHDINVLAPDVEFLFLSAHGAKHRWFNFRWICDIAQIIPRLAPRDVDCVTALSKELNSQKLLALALQLARDVFDLSLPPGLEKARRRYDTGPLARRVLAGIGVNHETETPRHGVLSRMHPAMPAFLFWISTRERWRDSVMSAADLVLKRHGRM